MRSRTVSFGVFVALALIFSYVETLIPVNFGIPGVKLGLANLIIVVGLYKLHLTDDYLLSVTRVVLAGFLFGNLFSIIYSLAGGILSLTVMAFAKYTEKFDVIAVSILGGISHNVGQLIVAALVLENISIFNYIPVLLIAGLVTGAVIGIVAEEILKRLKKVRF